MAHAGDIAIDTLKSERKGVVLAVGGGRASGAVMWFQWFQSLI